MDRTKNFLVSTADFAFYVNDVLACTGTTNLNTSFEVSMQEQNVNAGKGNQLVYSFKYGRELNANLEAADWKLEFIACQVGTKIAEGLANVYKIGECVTLNAGLGTLASTPIGDVAVELSNGNIITVSPVSNTIDLSKYGIDEGSVSVTYRYSRVAKILDIDGDSTPYVGRLVMNAEKHNNKLGKVGKVQIVIPSYQLSGNFTVNLTADGVSSTSLEGKALAVDGETCSDGSAVYAHIYEFDETENAIIVSDIAATPGKIVFDENNSDPVTISVVGLKGEMYSPIELENSNCVFVSETPTIATVDNDGVVKLVTSSAGSTNITVNYNGIIDTIKVEYVEAD